MNLAFTYKRCDISDAKSPADTEAKLGVRNLFLRPDYIPNNKGSDWAPWKLNRGSGSQLGFRAPIPQVSARDIP